jgi:hypothetical protein
VSLNFSSIIANFWINSLGIGGANPGLINGLAEYSGGSPAFLSSNSEIFEQVISQLSGSISPFITNAEIHIEGIDSFQCTPFPIPPLNDQNH